MAYTSLLPHHPALAFSTYPSPILLPFSAPFPVLAPPPPHTGIGNIRLARSPPTKANQVQSPAGSPDFCKWGLCWAMPLVSGFTLGSPVSPTPSFQYHSIFTSITLVGSQDLAADHCCSVRAPGTHISAPRARVITAVPAEPGHDPPDPSFQEFSPHYVWAVQICSVPHKVVSHITHTSTTDPFISMREQLEATASVPLIISITTCGLAGDGGTFGEQQRGRLITRPCSNIMFSDERAGARPERLDSTADTVDATPPFGSGKTGIKTKGHHLTYLVKQLVVVSFTQVYRKYARVRWTHRTHSIPENPESQQCGDWETSLVPSSLGKYGVAPECKGRVIGRTPRKPADQRHILAQFPDEKIQGATLPGMEPGSPRWEAIS
ncbi:hypothetical protein PR048_011101 [Dryococelus australis]|uniref:Uncharacterized protein n=1 Tax=Dryococelus australis TaxID=614101 RepID=A0ABQ9HL59_9NEOP|nr:hypothetical protein PR048_011101 [Dryococelus australis]